MSDHYEENDWRVIEPGEEEALFRRMFAVSEDYPIDDAIKDMKLVANMAGYVSSGFIKHTGHVKGIKVQFFIGSPDTED